MAVQQNKKSKSKSRSRRAMNNKLSVPGLSKCPNCGSQKLPHRVCSNCGFYKDKIVIDVK